MAARPGPRTDAAPGRLPRVFELFPRLAERRHHWGNQLSGGEQQMLTIGRALMTNPDLILIDEATEGLAPMVAQDDLADARRASAREGVATIVVDKDFRALSRARRPRAADDQGRARVRRHARGAEGTAGAAGAAFGGVTAT